MEIVQYIFLKYKFYENIYWTISMLVPILTMLIVILKELGMADILPCSSEAPASDSPSLLPTCVCTHIPL